MSSSDPKKKYKKPKQRTTSTTNPEASRPKTSREGENEPSCPLLAKDSEWVDILQPHPNPEVASSSSSVGEEEVLQLVECEDDPQTKPLAVMFPGLLEKDPQTLHGMLNKAMSTTEVTKHLVDLGQKANFTFMKKSVRLIPKDKEWLASVAEMNNSNESLHTTSDLYGSSNLSSDYDVDNETAEGLKRGNHKKRKKRGRLMINDHDQDTDTEASTTQERSQSASSRTEEDTADTARNIGGTSKRPQ